jgi:ribonucleoside-diphosphate reductase alpha chain
MELFDTTGEVISQASRRGAQIGILNVDHPDIMKFIRHKSQLASKNTRIFNEYSLIANEATAEISQLGDCDAGVKILNEILAKILKKVLAENQLTHFNISVAISNLFMNAVTQNLDWEFVPRGDSPKFSISAQNLLREIAENAWKTGDPGVYFIDHANEYNLAPYLGSLNATNPCGEIPLLPWESCCLGSINLYQFVENKFIDFDYLRFVVRNAVRFLDNVQTINLTPVYEINKATKLTRRLGLGVMGFADVLAEMSIPYNSPDAIDLAELIAKFIQTTAWEYSMELAEEKGSFDAFEFEKINWKLIDNLGLERKPVRNVAITSLAPTGTIALIADVNGSIEPFFAKNYKRHVTSGVGNVAEDTLDTNIGFEDVLTAHEIAWKDHINMQAIWQKYTDNAVSKTINMPEDVSPSEIEDSFIYAWEKKCKGITIYRNNSRGFQILNSS